MSNLHPWAATPDAARACKIAVKFAKDLQGTKIRALALDDDELLSLARFFLIECAQPKPETVDQGCAICGGSLAEVRSGSKFCSPTCRKRHAARVMRGKADALPPSTPGHIGTMHDWPEDSMVNYAAREVGRRIANHAVTEFTKSDLSVFAGRERVAAIEETDEPSEQRAEPVAFYNFRGPGYLKPSAEGNGHKPPVENYLRQADAVLDGTIGA